MGDVVSINRQHQGSTYNFMGAYIKAQKNQRIPEEVTFVAGVILTVGLPEYFLSVYGGLIAFIVFAVSLIVGVGLGVALDYYKLPNQLLSLRKQVVSHAPTNENDNTKKAA